MTKVVTLGEIMLRLSTNGYTRFVQSDNFDVVYGGGEANVAVSLANYGHESYFVTKLPKHEIGQCAINALRQYGVHTNFIARGGERVGIYFLETGASMRPSKVIYDRAHSSISEAKAEDFDFDAIFEGATWFHWTGITPALGKDAQEVLPIIDSYDGVLPFNDKVSPEIIKRETGMSKNEFKRAVGTLLKSGKIEITDKVIRRL